MTGARRCSSTRRTGRSPCSAPAGASGSGCRAARSTVRAACRRTRGRATPTKTIAVRDLLAWCRQGLGERARRRHHQRRRAVRAAGRAARAARRPRRVAAHAQARLRHPLLQRHAAAHAREEARGLLALLDAIIPEPYVNDLPQGNVWRGSRNQPLVAAARRAAAHATRRTVDETARCARQAHAGRGRRRPRVDDRHSGPRRHGRGRGAVRELAGLPLPKCRGAGKVGAVAQSTSASAPSVRTRTRRSARAARAARRSPASISR